MASFSLPDLEDNPTGWGPCGMASQFEAIPFAPFNKNDRLGRVSDWTNKFNNRTNRQFGQGLSDTFAYTHKDDESSFSLVDNTPKFKPKDGRRRFKKFSVHNRRRQGRGYRVWGNRRNWKGKDKNGRQRKRWGQNYTPDVKAPSVLLNAEWKQVATIEFDAIKKSWKQADAPQDLVQCGQLDRYETAFDRVSPRNSTNLTQFKLRRHFTATTSNDPVLQRLMSSKAGNVYGTDVIFGVLMASPRSINPWDLVVRRVGDTVIFDKRPTSRIDYVSVNENWNEVTETNTDSPNHPDNLSTEATYINHNFSQQVLKKADNKTVLQHKFKEQNPFLDSLGDGEEAASVAYRYRKWNLGDGINLVSRCTLNGYTQHKGERLYLQLKALNEFDSKQSGNIDWRQKLEQQTGAVLANEMKNNSNKLVRWTAEIAMSGAQELRLGFVSRTHTKDALKHVILKSQKYKPSSFAAALDVKIPNLWGVLKNIVTQCLALDEGTYLLVKDPSNPKMAIYDIGSEDPDTLPDAITE